jgi:hypothetical protein
MEDNFTIFQTLDDVASDAPLPHLLVTVTLGTTNETKIVPFDDLKLFRKEASPKRKKHSRYLLLISFNTKKLNLQFKNNQNSLEGLFLLE